MFQNPIWKLRYFEEIESVIQSGQGNTLSGDSQIIITTHDPMMVGSLRREQVRILRKENGKLPVDTPDQHPQGMGVAGLLKSELFGLRSTRKYAAQLRMLHQLGRTAERNQFIDDHAAHWGKLKLWLQVLSHGKWWFSEVRELYSHYDVEHFRPKKEAKAMDGTVRDGYWWLAFDYTNLRLCGNVGNRKKRRLVPTENGFTLLGI